MKGVSRPRVMARPRLDHQMMADYSLILSHLFSSRPRVTESSYLRYCEH